MKETSAIQKEDSSEKALKLLQKEEKDFRDHWIWKELGSSPEKFFEGLKKHVESLKIPPEKWNTAYQKAKEAHRVRALEKRNLFRPANLRLIGALRA